MKKNHIRTALIVGILCAALSIPSYSFGAEHWSKPYIEQLSTKYEVGKAFESNGEDTAVNFEAYKSIVRTVIDENYRRSPESMSREAVVHELMGLWEEKTGQDLDEIAVIKMIIYSDTADIDPDYNHSVTVAYMKGIAKGRDNGLFDPKTPVTYGELATLLCNLEKAIQNEIEPGNQGIARGRFETRGSVQVIDGRALFDFELMSHHTVAKQIKFGSGQQFEVVVTDDNGNEVYRYSDGKFFTMALLSKTVIPGEAIKWQDEWDLKDKQGRTLTSGDYKAEITIMVITEENDEKIDEIQLKTILEFSL